MAGPNATTARSEANGMNGGVFAAVVVLLLVTASAVIFVVRIRRQRPRGVFRVGRSPKTRMRPQAMVIKNLAFDPNQGHEGSIEIVAGHAAT